MVAVTADSVVVILEAQTERANAKIEEYRRKSIKAFTDVLNAANRQGGTNNTASDRAAAAAERRADREAKAAQRAADAVVAAEQRKLAAIGSNDKQDEARVGRNIERRLRLINAIKGEGAAYEGASKRGANATRNLGRQVADVGASFASGSSPFVILAQQAPQFADALRDVDAKAGSFKARIAGLAGFFGGPWGAALLAAGSVAAIFGAKLLEGEDSAKKQKSALDQLVEAIDKLNSANGIAANSEYTKALRLDATTKFVLAQEIATRKLIKAQLEQAQASEEANRGQGTAPGAVSGVAGQRVANLQAQLKEQDAKIALAERSSRVAGGGLSIQNQERSTVGKDAIAASAARVKKAQDDYALVLEASKQRLARGAISQARFDEVTARAAQVRDKVVNADALKNRGDAATRRQTAAERAAEQARLKEVRNDDAYGQRLAQTSLDLSEARAQLTSDTRVQDEALRQQIKIDQANRDRDVAAEGPNGTKRFSGQEVVALQNMNAAIASAKLDLVNRNETLRYQQEELEITQSGIETARDRARIDADLATTASERRDAALRLLDLDDQMERAQQEAILASKASTDAQKQIAQQRLDAINSTRPDRERSVNEGTRGPLEEYRRSLNKTSTEVTEAIQNIEVNALQSLDDKLTDTISNVFKLGGAFGSIADSIISDLIRIGVQRAIIAPLANSLFGAATGGSGGLLGGLLKSAGSLFGGAPPRASGGNVSAGQLYKVNETGTEGFRPAQSGTIIPLGRMKASGGGGTTVIQHISVDGRNSVTPADFADQVVTRANAFALQASVSSRIGASNDVRTAVRATLPRGFG